MSRVLAWADKSGLRKLGQAALGVLLLGAGIGHLTFLRTEFRAQVPEWMPLDVDFVVVASGIVEVLLGLALLLTWKQPVRAVIGLAAAAFFVAVFPGNIAQFTEHRDAFGLDSDFERGARLFFQPVPIVGALWATDALRAARSWLASRSKDQVPT